MRKEKERLKKSQWRMNQSPEKKDVMKEENRLNASKWRMSQSPEKKI